MPDFSTRSIARPWLALAILGIAAGAPNAAATIRPTPAVEEGASNPAGWFEGAELPDGAARVEATGHWLVYLEADSEGDAGAATELWRVALAGGAPFRLSGRLSPGDRVEAFVLSPDGRAVAYSVAHAGEPRLLFEVPIQGGEPRRFSPLETPAVDVGRFAFRPDSRALAFDSARGVTVVDLNSIFHDGFESGDTSAWSDTTATTCPSPTGGPTNHANSVATNQTWTANGSPHVLTTNVTVPAGITLTVAPCAELRIQPGVSLTVLGTLVARGTPLARITIHRDNPALPFASIWVRSPGFANIGYADLSGGGSTDAPLLIEGIDAPATQPVVLDHVKVAGSAGYGIRLFRNAQFAASSREVVVSGSGTTQAGSPFPVRMGLEAVGTLPTGDYRGNASDYIQVIIGGTLHSDLAFHDRGTPYQLGGGGSAAILTVNGSPGLATLTFEAGTEVHFYSDGSNIGGLFVDVNGRLVASGTATAPVVFTGLGSGAVPGSWEGISFTAAVDPGTLLDHTQIDAAGAHGGDQGYGCPPPPLFLTDGALKIFEQPGSEFLTHSTISNSISHGVFRAWTGATVDFLATNSFVGVTLCQQVLPHPVPPANCPEIPDCPQ